MTLGATQLDGLRVVETGLKAGEKVVVTGIQMVRQGEPVTPVEVAMPTIGPAILPTPQPGTKPVSGTPAPPAGTDKK